MTMVTGTPAGTICSQDDIYLEGSPYLYFQDYRAGPYRNPDADSYYWGLSGTATYCVYNLGCVNDVSLTEDVTVNNIRCDTVGDKDVVQRRNYIEFVFTLQTMFPLVQLRHLLGLSVPTVGGGLEKVGIGSINNNLHYMVYAPKVYDDATGDYLLFHLHKAKPVDAWTIGMGVDGWKITGLKFRAFADDTKPDNQKFGTIIRADPIP
jgi:hypothetical protein